MITHELLRNHKFRSDILRLSPSFLVSWSKLRISVLVALRSCFLRIIASPSPYQTRVFDSMPHLISSRPDQVSVSNTFTSDSDQQAESKEASKHRHRVMGCLLNLHARIIHPKSASHCTWSSSKASHIKKNCIVLFFFSPFHPCLTFRTTSVTNPLTCIKK